MCLPAAYLFFSLLQPTAAPGAPEPPPDHLTEIAASLERGDANAAIRHISRFLEQHPGHTAMRSLLAEQYRRLGRREDALREWTRIDREADPLRKAPDDHFISAQTRLMQAAIERHDPAAECYHRGVGLWAVVSSRSRTAPFDRDLRERTLCQAAAALRDSTRQRPEHARSHVYLAIVLSDLGEQAAARQALQTARRCPPLGLTDRERTVLLEADK